MRRNIKYAMFSILLSFMFLINIDAAEVIDTCYYNFTGVSDNKEEEYYVKVDFYDDNSAPKATGTDQSGTWAFSFDNQVANVRNWGVEDFKINAQKEYMKNKKCFDFLAYDTDGNDDQFYLLTYEALSNITPTDIKDGWWNDFWTKEPIIFVLIDSEDEQVAKTCQYENFSLNLNSAGGIVSVDSPLNLLPSTDMYMNKIPASSGCLPVHYCIDDDMSVKADAYLFYSSDGYNMFDIDPKNCSVETAKNDAYSGSVCYKYINFLEGNSSQNIKGIKQYANEYKACGNNAACIAEALGNYNTQKSKVTEWCNGILSSNNYDDGCLKNCLDLSNEIIKLEKEMKINNDNGQDSCSLGDTVAAWVANILNIVKYVVPVIVIIMSILDFIKAMGADKEDEMKKAQHRFVIRLVVAAVTFLVPFIIVFVLEVFNFDIEGCGIINFIGL